MADEPKGDPWEAEAARRAAASDPWEAEAARRQKANATWGDTGMDFLRGINETVASVATAPFRAAHDVAERARARGETPAFGLPDVQFPEAWLKGGYLDPPAPKDTLGKFAKSAGEVVGGTILPSAGILGKAEKMAKLAPTTLPRAFAQTIGEAVSSAPGRAVAADAAGSIGAGIFQQGAKEAEMGPGWEMLAGSVGAMTPAGLMIGANKVADITRHARASASPYERFNKGLGDTPLDDFANAVAVGNTNINLGNSRHALDVLGEEMVRHGGDHQAAYRAAINRIAQHVVPEAAERIENEWRRQLTGGTIPQLLAQAPPAELAAFQARTTAGNPAGQGLHPTVDSILEQEAVRRAPSTARDHLQRVRAAQAENQLLLGEYPSVARSDFDTRVARSRGPQHVSDEAAAARQESGVHDLMDYVANTGTMASSQNVRNALRERASTLTENAERTVQALSPNGRTIQDVEQMMGQARRLASRDYDTAHNGPVNYPMLHGLLQRAVDRALSRVAGRTGDQAEALNTAVERFFNTRPAGTASRDALPALQDDLAAARAAVREARRQRADKATLDDLSRHAEQIAENLRLTRRDATPATQQYLMPTLQQAQDARSALRGQITAAREADRGDLVQMLQPLYDQATYAMRRASPQWATANRRWADLSLDEVGAALGDAFATKAGPAFRRQMQQFNQLAPEAQEVVRVHFTQKLLDMIENAAKIGGTKNLGELFTKGHTRNMIRELLGDEAAVLMARFVRDANVMAASRDMMRGSQTHKRGQVQQEQDQDINIVSAAENMDWRDWKASALQAVRAFWRERRNKQLAKVLVTPMRDVPAVAEHLEQMKRARALAEQYAMPRGGRPPRQPAAGAQIGNILSAYE